MRYEHGDFLDNAPEGHVVSGIKLDEDTYVVPTLCVYSAAEDAPLDEDGDAVGEEVFIVIPMRSIVRLEIRVKEISVPKEKDQRGALIAKVLREIVLSRRR